MFTDLDLFEENYFSLVYLTMFTSTSIKNISVSEDYKSDFPLKQYLLLMLIGLIEQSHLKQYTDKTNLLHVTSSIPYIKSIYCHAEFCLYLVLFFQIQTTIWNIYNTMYINVLYRY